MQVLLESLKHLWPWNRAPPTAQPASGTYRVPSPARPVATRPPPDATRLAGWLWIACGADLVIATVDDALYHRMAPLGSLAIEMGFALAVLAQAVRTVRGRPQGVAITGVASVLVGVVCALALVDPNAPIRAVQHTTMSLAALGFLVGGLLALVSADLYRGWKQQVR